MNLETLTYPEVATLIKEDVPLLLPVGAIEQHGPHLPLGTDGIIPYELASRVATTSRLIVAPTMFYGAYSRPRSGGGRHFPGSVGLSGRVLERTVSTLLSDWFRQGFRNVVVLNGHWENAWTLLEAIEQAIAPYSDSGHRALLVHWWDQVRPEDIKRIFGDGFPGWEAEHASITETSMLEFLRPDLVNTELKAAGGAQRTTTYDIFPPPSDILWPNGIGNSALPASAAIGKQLVELLVERIGAIIEREFKAPTLPSPASGGGKVKNVKAPTLPSPASGGGTSVRLAADGGGKAKRVR